jgi:uncharacterized membrane protein (DUF106 family)
MTINLSRSQDIFFFGMLALRSYHSRRSLRLVRIFFRYFYCSLELRQVDKKVTKVNII